MTKSISKAILFGTIGGVLTIILNYIVYFIGINSFVGFNFIYKFLPIISIIIFLGALQYRNLQGGYISFISAVKFCMIAFISFEVIQAIHVYYMYNYFDKNLTSKVFDISLNKTIETMKGAGVSDAEIKSTMDNAHKNKPQGTYLKDIFLGFGTQLIWDFLLSCLIAVVVKREKKIID